MTLEPDAVIDRVDALLEFRRESDALAELEKGLGNHPESAALWEKFSWFKLTSGHNHEALDAVRRALGLEPNRSWALRLHSAILVQLGRYDDALLAAEKTLEHYPEWSHAHLQLASTLLSCSEEYGAPKQTERVLLEIDRALELEPENAVVLGDAARLYMRIGRPAEGLVAVNAALSINPTDPELLKTRLALDDEESAHDKLRALTAMLGENPLDQSSLRTINDAVFSHFQFWTSLFPVALLTLAVVAHLYFPFSFSGGVPLATAWALVPTALVVGFSLYRLFSLAPALPTGFFGRFFKSNWPITIALVFFSAGTACFMAALLGMVGTTTPPADPLSGLPQSGSFALIFSFLGASALFVGMSDIILSLCHFATDKRNSFYRLDPAPASASVAQIKTARAARTRLLWFAIIALMIASNVQPVLSTPHARENVIAAIGLFFLSSRTLNVALRIARQIPVVRVQPDIPEAVNYEKLPTMAEAARALHRRSIMLVVISGLSFALGLVWFAEWLAG